MSEEESSTSDYRYKTYMLWMGLLVLTLWISSPFLITFALDITSHNHLPNLGLVGDSYGALNTLFSGLAFAGLIGTIFMQSRELQLQREELKLSRVEQKEAVKQFESQSLSLLSQLKTMEKDQTSVMFNNLFGTLNNCLNSIRSVEEIKNSSVSKTWDLGYEYRGADAISKFAKNNHTYSLQSQGSVKRVAISEELVVAYANVFMVTSDWVAQCKEDELKTLFKSLVLGAHLSSVEILTKSSYFSFMNKDLREEGLPRRINGLLK